MNEPAPEQPVTQVAPTPALPATSDHAPSTEWDRRTGGIERDGWPEIDGYDVLEVLGAGGMGVVYKARQVALNRTVALKVLRPDSGFARTDLNRFRTEAEAVAALSHPGVVQVYQFGETDGKPFLALEYVSGGSLAERLRREPLEPRVAVRLVEKVARAVQAAHDAGIVHRDLKPGNILLDGAADAPLEECLPKVSDFGLAKRLDAADGQTQSGTVLGTPGYMAPEQAEGKLSDIGPATDVWALGAILYELLTGRRPFKGENVLAALVSTLQSPPPSLRSVKRGIPKPLEAVCLKCLRRNPADRYASAGELADDLRRWQSGRRVFARLVRTRRARLLWGVGCSLLALTLCVGGPIGLGWWFINKVTDSLREIQNSSERASAEWEAIDGFWQPPPADAGPDVLFPLQLPDGSRRVSHDNEASDPELGLTLPGRRAVYALPKGGRGEVRVYRCPDEQVKQLQDGVWAFVQTVKNGAAPERPGSLRQKVLYSLQDTKLRTVTFCFSDTTNQNQDYGKVWDGRGWLFYFRTSEPMLIESFPSKYLLEVGKQINALKKDAPKGSG